MCPHIPAGGRLQLFYHQWEKNPRQRMGSTNSKKGFKIKTNVRKTNANSIILDEVQQIIIKVCNRTCTLYGNSEQFNSTFIWQRKINGFKTHYKSTISKQVYGGKSSSK